MYKNSVRALQITQRACVRKIGECCMQKSHSCWL